MKKYIGMTPDKYEKRIKEFDEQIGELKDIQVLLWASANGYSLYEIPTVFEDYHNGDEIEYREYVWGKTAEEAKKNLHTSFDKRRTTSVYREYPIFDHRGVLKNPDKNDNRMRHHAPKYGFYIPNTTQKQNDNYWEF